MAVAASAAPLRSILAQCAKSREHEGSALVSSKTSFLVCSGSLLGWGRLGPPAARSTLKHMAVM